MKVKRTPVITAPSSATCVTWEEAVRGFVLHKKATRAPRTARFYRDYTRGLADWANAQPVPLDRFTKRHLDEYLVFRQEAGKSPTTLQHDALAATVRFEWCHRNDLIDRDPLAEYKVRAAPRPPKYMPTQQDVQRLLEALPAFYDRAQNPAIRYASADKRSFHRERNYAVEVTKLDTACRIGEILDFKVGDYVRGETGWQLTVREAKGRQPRVLPVSAECAGAINQWLTVRRRVMSDVPPGEDEGWLFISETGGRVNEGNYLRGIKKVVRWANLPEEINNHSQRRFSLNRMAKHNLLGAQAIAGHKDPKTTLIYTQIDPEFVREIHEQVGVVRNLLVSNRTVKRQRLVR